MTRHASDVELVERVLERDTLSDDARTAFEGMKRYLGDLFPSSPPVLSPKQRAWAEAVLDNVRYEPEPEYENLVSAGKVPRGREVELMVKDKPLRPPKLPGCR